MIIKYKWSYYQQVLITDEDVKTMVVLDWLNILKEIESPTKRNLAELALVSKRFFELIIAFQHQYTGIRKYATIQELQAYLSSLIWSRDPVRWGNEREQNRNIHEAKPSI